MLQINEEYVQHCDDGKSYRCGGSDWYEPYIEDRGRLFRDLQREYGRCVSKMFLELETQAGPVTFPIGWVFQKRREYEDAPGESYTAETWVEVREVEGRV